MPNASTGPFLHPVLTALALAAGLFAACADGGDDTRGERLSDPAVRGETAAAAAGAPAPVPAASGTDTSGAIPTAECPEMGDWRQCSVERRLERAGVVAIPQDTTVRYPFLDVPGIAYRLGAEELHVFLYPSAEARERDLAGVDARNLARSGGGVDWPATPTLMVSGNMAAILIGGTSRKVERVELALTAGLPQP